MKIRRYNADDHAACIELFKSNMPLFFDITELPALENWLTGLDQDRLVYSSNKAEHFFVIEVDNAIVGCGGYYIPGDRKVGNLTWGMVANQHHKKGYGRELMEYRIKEILQLFPGHSIILDTTQHSFQFFEKQGFIIQQITKDSYGKGLDRYDMVLTSLQ